MYNYNSENKSYARQLRKNMTKEERHLWYDFLQGYSVKFQRQKMIGNYIVDFFCAEALLAIELDGSGHYTEDGREYDRSRTNYLAGRNIQVLRFTNIDIHNNFEGVCWKIDKIVQEKCKVAHPVATTV